MMRPDLILASWLRTRRAMSMDAPALARRRARQWRALQPALAKTPALAAYHGLKLADYPITDTHELRADYGMWNSLGLSDAALRSLADEAELSAQTNSGLGAKTGGPKHPNSGAISAGWSSGSGGGNRGLFAANMAERADYLGQSLARLLPVRALLRRQRIALHLRASNALYEDARNSRISFAHFPLSPPPEATVAALKEWQPTILIAPPHRLLQYAKLGLTLPDMRHLFCGSEPVSAAESAFLEEQFGLRPRAIYQASEGFLGAECSAGQLHLNDHAIEIELEPVRGTDGFRPIITDLRRNSQPIVRLRGDDYLELASAKMPNMCPCGYGGRVIDPPQGRVADIWHLPDRVITPPQVVSAVENAIGGAVDWQAIAGPDAVQLRLRPNIPGHVGEAARQALATLTERPVELVLNLSDWPAPKRRKVVSGVGSTNA